MIWWCAKPSVGKNLVMKRFHARARGNSGGIEKFFSQITIVVEEKREAEKKQASRSEGRSQDRQAGQEIGRQGARQKARGQKVREGAPARRAAKEKV